MGEIYGWGAGLVGVVVAVIMAWLSGRNKGKAVAEEQRTREMINATKATAQREVTVSREAAHVDQKVNNSTDDDVDKQLLDKWTRPRSR